MVTSGVTTTNVHNYADVNATIIGSHLKTNYKWHNELEREKGVTFMDNVQEVWKKRKIK